MKPQDWSIKPLKQIISSVEAGVSVNAEDREISDDEIGVLKVSSVTYGTFKADEHKAILKTEIDKVLISPKKGKIIVSRANTPEFVGASAYVHQDYPSLFLSDKLWQLNVDENDFTTRWLIHVLNLGSTRAAISAAATGSSKSMKNISQKSFLKIKVPVPPLPEQKRIAEILEAWDGAIAIVEQLITAKQKLKKKLMQELLTKKHSSNHQFLPNQQKWDKGHFSDVAEVVMGQSPAGSTYNQDGIGMPLINGPTEFGIRSPIEIQWTSSPTKKCRPNDILLCVRGSSTGRINIAQKEYCIGRGIAAIRAKEKKALNLYLEYQLTFGINKLLALTAGSTFPNIDKKSIGKIPVLIPNLEEQKYIVDILSNIDREIHLLGEQNTYLQKQKKGLMQKLLTGEWPVPVEAEVAA